MDLKTSPPREDVDLLCVKSPRAETSRPHQALDFELVVSHARGRKLSVKTVGYPDQGAEPMGLEAALERWRPRCVYFHLPGRQAWNALREAGPITDLGGPSEPLVVAGGDFASRHDAGLLGAEPLLDGVLRGEPEQSLVSLVDALREGRAWQEEPGLSRRATNGVARTGPGPLASDLDALTSHLGDFFRPDRRAAEQRILLSRGCSSDCQYCGLQSFYRAELPGPAHSYWRPRSAASVLDEIAGFHHLGVRRFVFNSFVFFGQDEAGSRLVSEIAQGLLERGLEIQYRFITLSRDLRRNLQLLPLLKRAGLSRLTLGLDSLLARPLELYQVGSSRGIALDCLKALAENEIPFDTAYIFYDPYTTLGEVRENLRVVESLAPFYRHMEAPYSYFLDQQIVSTTLQVRWSTPLYEKLLRDGLAEHVDTLERDPRIGFRHPEVGRLFQAHGAVNRLFLPSLRPLLFSPEVVARFPNLESFPVDLLGYLVSCYEEDDECAPEDAIRRGAKWIHDRISPEWNEAVSLLEPNEPQRMQMARCLEGLARYAAGA